tara:strand:+ start:29 stop:217 length:189 start_codon:yes stop_codon:yes gene_type:complete
LINGSKLVNRDIFYQELVEVLNYDTNGGETGIRTPEPVAQLLPFQGSAIDHSAISPVDDDFT